jgi:hypothetical protein
MRYLHCTKKLLDRLKPEVIAGGTSTTGSVTGMPRYVLAAHGIRPPFIEQELVHMQDVRYTKTINRSVVGIMAQFSDSWKVIVAAMR